MDENNNALKAINQVEELSKNYIYNEKGYIYLYPLFYDDDEKFTESDTSITFPTIAFDLDFFITYWINCCPQDEDLRLLYQYVNKKIGERYNNRLKKWKAEYIALKSSYGDPFELKEDDPEYMKQKELAQLEYNNPSQGDMPYLIKILAMRYNLYTNSSLTKEEKEFALNLNFILPDRNYIGTMDELLNIYAINFIDFISIFVFKDHCTDNRYIENNIQKISQNTQDALNTIIAQNDRMRQIFAEFVYLSGL